MTKQNMIHKSVVAFEKEHKETVKGMQRSGYKRKSRKNRKWWRQWHKDWYKTHKLENMINNGTP